jgi:hypothetical protein
MPAASSQGTPHDERRGWAAGLHAGRLAPWLQQLGGSSTARDALSIGLHARRHCGMFMLYVQVKGGPRRSSSAFSGCPLLLDGGLQMAWFLGVIVIPCLRLAGRVDLNRMVHICLQGRGRVACNACPAISTCCRHSDAVPWTAPVWPHLMLMYNCCIVGHRPRLQKVSSHACLVHWHFYSGIRIQYR